MDRRATVCRWVVALLMSFPAFGQQLPEGCETKEQSYSLSGNAARLSGQQWTDVVELRDHQIAAVSEKFSKIAILSSQGLVLREMKLPDARLRPMQISVQPSGRIVVAGIHTRAATNGALYYEVQVVGFTADGILDPTFGQGGTFHYPSITGYVNAAVRCDGRIVLAFDHGYTVRRKLRYEFVVMRLETDGSLDSTFGIGGASALRVGQIWNSPETLQIRPNGAILVGGQVFVKNAWEAVLFQMTERGPLDSNFGDSGVMNIRSFSNTSSARSISFLPDQTFFVAGMDSGTNWITISKHNPNGFMDIYFASGGISYHETPSIEGQVQMFTGNAVQALANGSFLVGGHLKGTSSQGHLYLVAHYDSVGQLDKTFGTNGFVSIPLPNEKAGGELIAQLDGRFVIAAESRQPESVMLHHFEANGSIVHLP